MNQLSLLQTLIEQVSEESLLDFSSKITRVLSREWMQKFQIDSISEFVETKTSIHRIMIKNERVVCFWRVALKRESSWVFNRRKDIRRGKNYWVIDRTIELRRCAEEAGKMKRPASLHCCCCLFELRLFERNRIRKRRWVPSPRLCICIAENFHQRAELFAPRFL